MITETSMSGCSSMEVIIKQVSKISSKQVQMKSQCLGICLRMNGTASVTSFKGDPKCRNATGTIRGNGIKKHALGCFSINLWSSLICV